MGPAGAAAVALLSAIVGGVGAILVGIAWKGSRAASPTGPARWARNLAPVGLVLLALGVLLPKRVLRALAFEDSGRVLMLAVAVVGAVAALAAWRRREPGAGRTLLAHLYFASLAASPVGEWMFDVFRTL